MSIIVVAGALANKQGHGGAAWTRLSWALGLQQLGFDVVFIEQLAAEHCVGESGVRVPVADSLNFSYFNRITAQFSSRFRSTLVIDDGAAIYGMERREVFDLVDASELLVNISGHVVWPEIMRRARRKAFIDLDPGYTQLWAAAGNPGARLDGHDLFFTVGENIGHPRCSIPTGSIRWRPIRQPVVLDQWPVSCSDVEPGRFTTVASWRGGLGAVEHNGQTFGVKAHEFRKFLDLPKLAPRTFEIALDIHAGDAVDRAALLGGGWKLVDPRQVAAGPDEFRRYVQTSWAEWSAAQGIYVQTQSGWFSDRTVRYLASGKPALVQDTGFTSRYPVGEGLLAFRTAEEARTGAAGIAARYGHHCRVARQIAEEWFASDKVLSEFIDQTGISS